MIKTTEKMEMKERTLLWMTPIILCSCLEKPQASKCWKTVRICDWLRQGKEGQRFSNASFIVTTHGLFLDQV